LANVGGRLLTCIQNLASLFCIRIFIFLYSASYIEPIIRIAFEFVGYQLAAYSEFLEEFPNDGRMLRQETAPHHRNIEDDYGKTHGFACPFRYGGMRT
jgi:hypothetical protein